MASLTQRLANFQEASKKEHAKEEQVNECESDDPPRPTKLAHQFWQGKAGSNVRRSIQGPSLDEMVCEPLRTQPKEVPAVCEPPNNRRCSRKSQNIPPENIPVPEDDDLFCGAHHLSEEQAWRFEVDLSSKDPDMVEK